MNKTIQTVNKKNFTYNLTYSSNAKFYYPKNYHEIKKILTFLKKTKQKALIKSGKCGYGDKTNLQRCKTIISLINLDKIIKFQREKKIIKVQAGIYLYELLFFLQKKGYAIYNIPGGKKVSLGGAIAGNVHGRPANENYATFGDNIISLKVMLEDGNIKKIRRKNKLFNKFIGGLGLFGIILEADIKVFKIYYNYYEEITTLIKSKKSFNDYQKKLNYCVGIINFFKLNSFEGKFYKFIGQKKADNRKIINSKKNTIFDIINFFKIPTVISFFVNSLTLRIFYYFLFKKQEISKGTRLLDYKRSVFLSDVSQSLPYYYRGGLIEIQFGFPEKKLFYLVKEVKKIILKFGVFPIYFIVKKMNKSNKKYIFNFPKNKFSITLSFQKKNYIKNKLFFKILYKILEKNRCNLYITKDETFIENIAPKNTKKYFDKNIFKKNKILSSDFKEKIIN